MMGKGVLDDVMRRIARHRVGDQAAFLDDGGARHGCGSSIKQ
jgi:hypothetical protein